VLGAEPGHKLGCLLVGERIAEGRHLLAAVENLMCDLGWGPAFVLAQTGQVRRLFAACAACAVAMDTALVAKENRAGLLGGSGFCAKQGVRRDRGEK